MGRPLVDGELSRVISAPRSDARSSAPPLRPAYDLIDLVLFSHVARCGSITAGAAETALSLAAASTRIRDLENAFGTSFFDRTASGVKMTAAGVAFEHGAIRVLAELRQLQEGVDHAIGASSGHIRIVSNVLAARDILPNVVARYLACTPGVTIDVHETVSRRIPQLVKQAQADIGIIIGDFSETAHLDVLPFRSIDWVLVVARDHPLAARDIVSFVDALPFAFIGRGAEGSVFQVLESLARARGAKLQIRAHVASFESMCRLATEGVGVAVVPRMTAERLARTLDIVVIGVSDAWSRRTMHLCLRRNQVLPKYAQTLVDMLLDGSNP